MFHMCFLYFLSFTICFEFCHLLVSVVYTKSKQTETLLGEMANTEHVVLMTAETYRELFNAQEICTCKI